MNISLIGMLVLVVIAVIELFWHSKQLKKASNPLRYIWVVTFFLALVYYFRSPDFDFALLLVMATAVSGIVALIDQLFLRKQRIADAESAADTGNIEQTQVDNSLPPNYKEPLIIEYSRSFFPVLLLVLVLRSFIFEPFRIPSGSMYPTLEVGDFIVVSKFSYGLRLPVINTKILPLGEPSRGDVVVFKYPENPRINYIKRVVGLPGDTVSYRNKTVYINGQRQDIDYQGLFSYKNGYGQTATVERYTETLGDIQHDMLINSQRSPSDGEWRVPEGHYFVMGDNRDDSKDSRYWKYLPEENLVGKAKFIWLHLDIGGNGFDAARIGTKIK